VEFFNPFHKGPNCPDEEPYEEADGIGGMGLDFLFRKEIKRNR
jgi:hypothetical protein